MAIGLLARVYRNVTAEKIERFDRHPERPAIADRTDRAGVGQILDHPLDRRIHLGSFDNLIADQAPFRTVAKQLALILHELASQPVPDKAMQPQIRSTGNNALLP